MRKADWDWGLCNAQKFTWLAHRADQSPYSAGAFHGGLVSGDATLWLQRLRQCTALQPTIDVALGCGFLCGGEALQNTFRISRARMNSAGLALPQAFGSSSERFQDDISRKAGKGDLAAGQRVRASLQAFSAECDAHSFVPLYGPRLDSVRKAPTAHKEVRAGAVVGDRPYIPHVSNDLVVDSLLC